MTNSYKKYKELGLCVRCGSERFNNKTRCEKCHTEHLNYQAKSKTKAISNGMCRYCLSSPVFETKSMCKNCLEKHSTKQKELYAFHRKSCIDAYGGQCACCGLSSEKYLQLDHINNDGKDHRKQIYPNNHHRGSMYTWAFRNNFPNNLQLLCANCHQAKTSGKSCTPEDHIHFCFCVS